jgi:GTP-binding protein
MKFLDLAKVYLTLDRRRAAAAARELFRREKYHRIWRPDGGDGGPDGGDGGGDVWAEAVDGLNTLDRFPLCSSISSPKRPARHGPAAHRQGWR